MIYLLCQIFKNNIGESGEPIHNIITYIKNTNRMVEHYERGIKPFFDARKNRHDLFLNFTI